MPFPTPFHPRTSALCDSYRWKEWAGYHAVCSYDTCHGPEYHALRHACGVIDVSPLYKYRVAGRDAARFLSRVLCRDAARLRPGRVAYTTWCDDQGKILDDGTLTCLEPSLYRLTAAEPAYQWLLRHTRGLEVTVEDRSAAIATLAVQGPTSRALLAQVSDAAVDALNFFAHTRAVVDGVPVEITRTGYTGDLGYEVWMENRHALAVWDALFARGADHGLMAAGLDALDVTRVEAGFVLHGVDYHSARDCIVEAQKSTPYELDLGWTVHLDRAPFVGQGALRAERERGPQSAFVGLDLDWEQLERLFAEHGLPPNVPAGAWRDARPVYDRSGRQVGRATSGCFSPALKKNLALATVDAAQAGPGTRLRIEVTVEYERRTVDATVVRKPFFDPPRKRS